MWTMNIDLQAKNGDKMRHLIPIFNSYFFFISVATLYNVCYDFNGNRMNCINSSNTVSGFGVSVNNRLLSVTALFEILANIGG